MFQEEIAELEKGFITLIASVLSKIRAKCVGSDHVLDDEGGKFSEFFLNSAKNRLSDAYLGYVFTAKTERNDQKRKHTTIPIPSVAPKKVVIKTEIKEEPNIQEEGFYDEWEHATRLMVEKNLLKLSVEQETTVSQSNDDFLNQLFDEPGIQAPKTEPNHSRNSSPIANIKSQKSHTPNGCHDDISNSAKLEHLAAQKKLLSTLFVTGLPIIQDDLVVLSKMFIDLCHHIHISIDAKEIVSIEMETVRHNEHNLVVQLNDPQQKENIIRIAQRHKGLKASEFMSFLPMTLKPKNIHIYPKLTKFYEELKSDAIAYLHDRKLYSFRVCSQGLAVRCSKYTPEKYIKSPKELEILINGFSPHLKRVNEEPLVSIGLSSSKQSRIHTLQ